MSNLYLSETAYLELVQLAKQCGFVRPASKNAVGLTKFLSELSYQKFEDSRPDWAKRQHEAALQRECHPDWTLGGERRISRMIRLDEETQLNYMQVAIEKGVYIVRRLVNGGQLRRTPLSITGNVIEAIGIGWLTPDQLPMSTTGEADGRIQHMAVKRRSRSRVAQISEEHPYYFYLRRGPSRSKTSSTKS